MPRLSRFSRPSNGPEAAAYISTVAAGLMITIAVIGSIADLRKAVLARRRADDLRQLVDRYEKLAETTLDAQRRTAADVAELQVRTVAIEKILRSVDD
jgi:hypothetical protein